MPATLTSPVAGGTSFRFLNHHRFSQPNSTGSNRTAYFASTGRTAFRASLHAVLEAEPVVESTNRRPASLYEVLRVKRSATPMEIKTAYRTLAKVYHPDSSYSTNDDRDFIEIHNAYATLSDPAARAVYDLKLNTGVGRRTGICTAAGNRPGFYTSRRWETDQCW